MAKRPNTRKKVSSEALSAVEEALKIDFNQEASADAQSDPYEAAPVTIPEPANVQIPAPAPVPIPAQAAEPAIAPNPRPAITPGAPAANDDRRSGIAQFSASMAQKPSSATFWLALLLSLIWGAAAIFAGNRTVENGLFNSSTWLNIADNPSLIYFIGSLVLPLLLIWGFCGHDKAVSGTQARGTFHDGSSI